MCAHDYGGPSGMSKGYKGIIRGQVTGLLLVSCLMYCRRYCGVFWRILGIFVALGDILEVLLAIGDCLKGV